ncbi:MAG TPA: carboxymuconolactone decarboxylase family protein [Thermodesulfobacteriota bacterium]|nr:carboxymuconolactone decarboxylase family protein [Thermodesulfobacteriota bacterium]
MGSIKIAHSNRYKRGLENLKKIDGESGEKVIKGLEKISSDFATYLIEYPFGDIYNRPGLDLRSREIATIAALTALGNARPQLMVHISAALNVGLTREEIKEIIIQMSVYSGFPSAINGLTAAEEVFNERAGNKE